MKRERERDRIRDGDEERDRKRETVEVLSFFLSQNRCEKLSVTEYNVTS